MLRLRSRWSSLLIALWSVTNCVIVCRAAASFAASRHSFDRSHQRSGRCWSDVTKPGPAKLIAPCGYRNQNFGFRRYPRLGASLTALYATKKSSKNSTRKVGGGVAKSSSSSSSLTGFGGAAVEPCSCGSNAAYNKCCGQLHRDPQAFATARPSEVVRARYTAYAKRVVDCVVASTHPLNPTFSDDMEHWKRTIETNGYDNFLLNSCVILEEAEGDTENEATVKFLAKMTHRDTGERTAFVETSTFLRDPETGAWLYRDGVIESAEDDGATEDGTVDT